MKAQTLVYSGIWFGLIPTLLLEGILLSITSHPIPPTSTLQTESAAAVFSDSFTTNPNTNGLWSIYRYDTDTTNQCNWDSTSRTVYITRAVGGKACAMFANYNLTATSWTSRFRYKAGGGTGADGFVFIFYKSIPYVPGQGGNLGFQHVASAPIPGYGIEFDGWQNSYDPSPNHIAILDSGTDNHISPIINDSRTEDNTWHKAIIKFINGRVIISVDEGIILDYTISNPNYTYSKIGFSAATGGQTNNYILDYFSLSVP